MPREAVSLRRCSHQGRPLFPAVVASVSRDRLAYRHGVAADVLLIVRPVLFFHRGDTLALQRHSTSALSL